jgi:hypothetical protein
MTFAIPVHAAIDFMPLDEIKPGMRGVGKTVVSGNKIEEFGVEVIGVMKQRGPAGDLILVRTFGGVMDRTGGIAQGMSGSPVYINNKLIGAVAYGWGLTDHKTGMLTPIADMLKLWELPDTLRDVKKIEAEKKESDIAEAVSQKNESIKENSGLENSEVEKTDNPILKDKNDNMFLNLDGTIMQIPKTTTLMASGFGDNALSMLAKELKPYGLSVMSGASSVGEPGIAYNTPQPGSMVAVELIRGDVSLASMGTVTYVADGKILAFGHPFMKRGNVNYFLSDASVFTTLPGLENSFKISSSGAAIGVVNQDRGAGIAGKLGVFPAIVPVRITVHDKSMGVKRELTAQVAHDESITPILSAVTLFNAIEKTSDRTGPGTAKVKFEITAQDLPVDKFVRENMFYTGGNIGELAISELFEAMAILSGNQHRPVNVIDVKIDVELEKERRTASIMAANAEKKTAKPGETVDIMVKLKPYRQEPITRKVSFIVPKNQPAGNMMVSVRGGGVASLNQVLNRINESAGQDKDKENIAKMILSSRAKPRTFEDAIKSLTERDRYHDIVVEILNVNMNNNPRTQSAPVRPVIPEHLRQNDTAPKPAEPGKNNQSENMRKFNIVTDYIIDSETQFVIEVAGQ